MFDKILIANRGEIAVRIMRTCRRLGIKTALVYSDADAASLAVELADEAIHIGPSPAAQSYLLADKIIAAVRQSGAQAVHPGFGFLSEKAAFAEQLAAESITFIGPNPHAIHAMGDKIESKKTAALAGVSTVPGHLGEINDVATAIEVSEQIGYPVMIKASAGGGGKGIRVAHSRKDVEEGFPAVRAEASVSFGDDRVFIEKFVLSPRHIEIQVLGDKHGNIVHLFERECSIQRRNQKVIEEAPSTLLDAATRAQMGAQAVALARAVGYDSAGTVEFVASSVDKSFYFLEMNTRLQVEHPVTEMITGLDLVEQMIRVAAGQKLAFGQDDLAIHGWAIESRLYAEDPYRDFLPSIGRLRRLAMPQEGDHGSYRVRSDSGVREGDTISMFYDPMIAKLITWAPDRLAAIDAHANALDEVHVEGIASNAPFLSAVMEEKVFRSGDLTTGYIKSVFPQGFAGVQPDHARMIALVGAALFAQLTQAVRAASLDGQLDPRRTAPLRRDWVVLVGEHEWPVSADLSGDGHTLDFQIDGQQHRLVSSWVPGQAQMRATFNDRPVLLQLRADGEGWRLSTRGASVRVLVLSARSAQLHKMLPPRLKADTSRVVVSPMPGLIVSIDVTPGQEVKAGEAACIVEAMKMQNIIRFERDGTVAKVLVSPGAAVAADDVLVELS